MSKLPNSIFFDFKRMLTSKTVIILMLLPILISFAIIPFLAQASVGPQPGGSSTRLLAYRGNDGYHFLAFSTNQYGQPLSGVNVQVNLTRAENLYSGGGVTNSSGYAFVTVHVPTNDSYYAEVSVKEPSGHSMSSSRVPLTVSTKNGTSIPLPLGRIISIFYGPMSIVTDDSNATKRMIQVFWTASFGLPPTDFSVYYKYVPTLSGGGGSSFELNRSQMHLLGTMTGYSKSFSPPALPKNFTRTDGLMLGLFYSNGTAAYDSPLFVSVDQLYPQPMPPIQTSKIAGQFFQGIMGFFIPLMAIIGSYVAYGKDRVSGVLESVLSRPVTRRGLAMSRYLSCYLALAVATLVAIGVVDAIVWSYSGSLLDSQVVVSAMCAFLVELAAFVGMIFLVSRLVKSTGALIGISIGLFVVLDFFWSLIAMLIASASSVTVGSARYLQISVLAAFANPTQFLSLLNAYLENQFQAIPIVPSAYGITIASLTVAGLLWFVVPLAVFLYLAIKRD